MILKKYLSVLTLLVFTFLIFISFYKLPANSFLAFSDGAKFADIGRNIASGFGYGSSFTRYTNTVKLNKQGLFSAELIPPATPLLNALSFKLFGVSDISVIDVSAFFYFVLVLATYLLGKKIWGNLAGLISATAVGANLSLLSYAVTGASETLFAAEIIIVLLLFTLKQKWSGIVGFIVLILMFFTRAQAPFYILPLLFYFIQLKTENFRKTLKTFSLIVLACFVLLTAIIFIPGLSFGKSFIERVFISLAHNSSFAPANDILRMGQNLPSSLIFNNILPLFKKLLYNLYNFYKLLPNIFSPYLFILFIISLFSWKKSKTENALQVTAILTTIFILFVNALTIPLFRYFHPLIPVIYLFAGAELVTILQQISQKKFFVSIVSAFLILVFTVGQTIGYIFLDSRFFSKTINKNKPPAYVALSETLKENSNNKQIIVTNLDTWGSWYGERKTIWFPLSPNDLKNSKIQIDAIYLTSYLMDDENNYMGQAWRQIFENPTSIQDKFIAENFKVKGIFEIKADDTYEKQSARAVLLIKK